MATVLSSIFTLNQRYMVDPQINTPMHPEYTVVKVHQIPENDLPVLILEVKQPEVEIEAAKQDMRGYIRDYVDGRWSSPVEDDFIGLVINGKSTIVFDRNGNEVMNVRTGSEDFFGLLKSVAANHTQ